MLIYMVTDYSVAQLVTWHIWSSLCPLMARNDFGQNTPGYLVRNVCCCQMLSLATVAHESWLCTLVSLAA